MVPEGIRNVHLEGAAALAMFLFLAWWNWNRKSKAKKKTGGDPSFNDLTKKINESKLSSSDPNYPFEGIKNFRDPADQITSLKSGKLYRTGNPSNGTEKDAETIRSRFNVKTFVDLRNSREISQDTNINGFMYEDCLDFIYENECLKAKKPSTSTEVEGKRFRYFMSLLEERNLGKVLFSRFSLLEKIKVILLGFLAKFLPEAKALLMEIFYAEIMSGGLKLINELAIDFAGREMVEVLKLFLKEENYPIAFYCTAGKDRTGLIAMLLLSVLGATDEEIVRDYQISDSVYRTSKSAGNAGLDLPEQQREEVEKEAEQIDPFLRATPDIILHVLAYTRRLHGSIPKYLERNGFDKTAQNRLRELLLKTQ